VGDPIVGVAEVVDGDPLSLRDVGHRQRVDREDHDVFVQDVIVLDVRPHRQRSAAVASVEEDGRAGDAHQRWPAVVELVDERAQRSLLALPALRDERTAALPRGQHSEHGDGDQQRKPGTVREFGQVRGQEQELNGEESGGAR
jgi:hypothetical protein